jgi:hypothetical protein
MTVSKQYSPPRKGPQIELELQRLYRRRALIEELIRSLELYVQAGAKPLPSRSRVA